MPLCLAIFYFLVEMESHHAAEADLELRASSNPRVMASPSPGITGVSQHARPPVVISYIIIVQYQDQEIDIATTLALP